MAKGCDSQQEPAMENSQECDPQDNTREMEGSDMETQLDLETLRHFESQFELSPVDQLLSTCCYGRGKALADIVLPRLPKSFQDESYTVADPGFVDVSLLKCCSFHALVFSIPLPELVTVKLSNTETGNT